MRDLTMVQPVHQQATGLPTPEAMAAALRSFERNTSLGPLGLRLDRTVLQRSLGSDCSPAARNRSPLEPETLLGESEEAAGREALK